MEPSVGDETGESTECAPPQATKRCTIGCLAVLFGLLAFWIAWIVATFLHGGGWFELVVGLVLDEVILAVGLLAAALLIWALFVPARMSRVFDHVCAHAAGAAWLFFAVLIVPWLLFAVVWSVLSAMGVVR